MGTTPNQVVTSIGKPLAQLSAEGTADTERTKDEPNYDQITSFAVALGCERLRPSLGNPDYLVLNERRKHFSDWVQLIRGESLCVLDIGGRIQPYRPLLESRSRTYVAIDPLVTRLVDVVAVGEQLPFRDESFDLVLCTQVLCYADDPSKILDEIYRVLRPGGILLLSAPAVFPSHAENDRWRFLPQHMLSLLSSFSDVEIRPEGRSIAGLFRMLTTFLEFCVQGSLLRRIGKSLLIPLANCAGEWLDRWSCGDTRFTTNYCAFARK
jgi:SAM-dependent methyltransferase